MKHAIDALASRKLNPKPGTQKTLSSATPQDISIVKMGPRRPSEARFGKSAGPPHAGQDFFYGSPESSQDSGTRARAKKTSIVKMASKWYV